MNELIQRFAQIQNISYDEAEKLVGAETNEEILQKISDFTINKINQSTVKLNRKQRRALQKKYGIGATITTVNNDQINVINETAKKLSYIDLIQKLRKLNEEKEKENENGESIIENN